ncbi:mRNA decapping enzyme [Achlya hypogyna]|uniref:mRNA decapping enzyme n=1 Tax=Achlya hypogyna TaxID=1202772 RepID=A0A1V9Z8L0_ACHHY|nr:mRNA decapping enzyme [Achlya hypogyna]
MMQVATPSHPPALTPHAAKKPTMEEVMDELQSRFLMNLPESELSSSERLFFQIEQCYWFYEDFYADHHAHLTHLKLNDFARKLFNHCILLQPLKAQCESMFQDFKAYQSQIPVVGGILLNPAKTKLILVRNWKGTSWSLPRGKVNQGESDVECAKREVFEECGYAAPPSAINPKDYIEFTMNQQRMRMYIITCVPDDFAFAPQTRKEISLIQWFEFDDLPKKTWGVLPFMSRLRRWITSKKNEKKGKKGNGRNGTPAKGRSVSAPRNRPGKETVNAEVPPPLPPTPLLHNPAHQHLQADNRSYSTPQSRPRKANRGHFGTEKQIPTASDEVNEETFGARDASFSFNVEEMFSVNEQLTGVKFTYNGNPHDFGKVTAKYTHATTPFQPPLPKGPPPPLPSAAAPATDSVPATADGKPPKPKSPQLFAPFTFDTGDIMACVT